tara:strand:+ start:1730 stop:1945 length:216 start_codon:yes stop_codon:yes gene_type:complete
VILVDLVNLVNYKIYMDDKNNIKNGQNNKLQSGVVEGCARLSQTGIYLRDDHCDWGSSGMNEFTKEYSEDK